MPSHSPYALSSLTFYNGFPIVFVLCLVFELFKNQRFFSSEIEVTLEHFCSLGKTFSTFFLGLFVSYSINYR